MVPPDFLVHDSEYKEIKHGDYLEVDTVTVPLLHYKEDLFLYAHHNALH